MSARVAPVCDIEAGLGALGGEVAALLRPLLAPLVEKWEWVTGDDEQVHETARRWRAMGRALGEVAGDQLSSARLVTGEWEGSAHDAFDEAVVVLAREMEEVADRVGDVAHLLDEAADAVRHAEIVIAELIHELIEWAALSLAISAAGAIVTLGASAAAGAAAAAAKAGVVGARIATQLGRLAVELQRIRLLLGVYQAWVKQLSLVQKQLVKKAQGLVLKEITTLDGSWKKPALTLASIRVQAEVADRVDQPAEGLTPTW